jgi:nicotinate-nucleotide adenylyltransferase
MAECPCSSIFWNEQFFCSGSRGAGVNQEIISKKPGAESSRSSQAGSLTESAIKTRDPVLMTFAGLQGRVGIIGGSFNPVHNGHLEIARQAKEKRDLDQIIFIPAAQNPLKDDAPEVTGEDRLEMIRLALLEESELFVSPYELGKAGVSFTFETLEHIKGEVDEAAELFFIIGADCVAELHLWKNLDRIMNAAKIVPFSRDSFADQDFDQLTENLDANVIKELKELFVSDINIPISSTMIREGFWTNPEISKAMPRLVAEFIREHVLYKD